MNNKCKYRLRIKKGRKWAIGIKTYSYDGAIARQKQLKDLGIESKIEKAGLVFDGTKIYK